MRSFSLFLMLFLIFLNYSCNQKKPFVIKEYRYTELNLPPVLSIEHYEPVKELSSPSTISFLYYNAEGKLFLQMGEKSYHLNAQAYERFKKEGAVFYGINYLYDGRYLYVAQIAKPGFEKFVVLMRFDPSNGQTKSWMNFSTTKQPTNPPILATDKKGNILIAWNDESVNKKAIAYALVQKFGDVIPEKEEFLRDKDYAYTWFAPIYNNNLGFGILYIRNSKDVSEVRLFILSSGKDILLLSAKGDSRPIHLLYDLSGDTLAFSPYSYEPKAKIYLFNLREIGTGKPEKEYVINLPEKWYEPQTLKVINGDVYLIAGFKPNSNSIHLKEYNFDMPAKLNLYVSVNGNDFKKLTNIKYPYMFTEVLPSLDFSKEGILIAYRDNRFIDGKVGLVYMKGDRIVKSDVLIETSNFDALYPKVINLTDDTFRVLYLLFDENKRFWTLKVVDLKAKDAYNLVELPPEKELVKKLKESTQKLTQCRVKNDIDCFYSMLDPGYRYTVTKEMQVERIRRLGVEVVDMKYKEVNYIEGTPFAIAKGIIKYKFVSDKVGGIAPVPKKDVGKVLADSIEHIWIFIDGNWYWLVDLPMKTYSLTW